MKYIKDGKLVLDGTYRECDLEEKLFKALEIVVDKKVDFEYLNSCINAHSRSKREALKMYNLLADVKLSKEDYELIREVLL